MHLIYNALLVIIALFVGLALVTQIGAALIERGNPPVGTFATVNGTRMHFVHVPRPANATLPPIVFLHGASGNLLDQMRPIRALLEGRAEMLFVDRPGHGWSSRGPDRNSTLVGQADTLDALMTEVGIGRAVIVGHSFGGAVVATFAVTHPGRVSGLVFLSAATHPWPGGGTSWYYTLAARPIIGWIFVETLALPAAYFRMAAATVGVFSPNKEPDRYAADAGIALVLRPKHFRANAIDVAALYEQVTEIAPRYREIAAPTVVITGDRDGVVLEEIHSVGLVRDIKDAELVQVHNLGHKPDWVAPELTVAAIETVSGMPRDLQAIARAVEARIAGDNYGVTAAPEAAKSGEFAPAD